MTTCHGRQDTLVVGDRLCEPHVGDNGWMGERDIGRSQDMEARRRGRGVRRAKAR